MSQTQFQKQALALKKAIRFLVKESSLIQRTPHSLLEQPFDSALLKWSPLYKRSRELYLNHENQNGKFIPTLVSSARSLSSTILLEQMIEYSPIERELIWSALDPRESKNVDHLLRLRTYSSSLFHEQNHRILWRLLPSAPKEEAALRRYLNFVESLVITLDMALADHLGRKLAFPLYLSGVTYDPGTNVRKTLKAQREYRNYLQATLHCTYLTLECYEAKDIAQVAKALFPQLGNWALRAAERSGNLDALFIQNTNILWQKRNRKQILKALHQPQRGELLLKENPLDNVQQYLFAEKYFDLMSI